MTDQSNPIVARTLFHATYVNPGKFSNSDAVIVSEMVEYADGTIEPNLKTIRNPEVKFWTTQKGFRDHPEKKELEKLSRLDEHLVPYKSKDEHIFQALNGYWPRDLQFHQKRELYKSPYLYGGNITVEALVAMKYKKALVKQKRIPHAPTTGFLDIEKSLLPSSFGTIPLISFVTENKVFLAMHQGFMWEDRGTGRHEHVSVDDIRQGVQDHIEPLVADIFRTHKKSLKDAVEKMPFQYHFHIAENEVEMIQWIFEQIHANKTSFIGIWNISFDIPNILAVLEREGVRYEDIFAHPTIRNTPFAYTSYREDKRKVAHISQKWNWLTSTAYYQFVDSQSLYSYIRMVDGKEASYKLDDILIKFGLGGKLTICDVGYAHGTPDWHRAMLKDHYMAYALYAMWDSMSLQILEWINTDITAMILGGDVTPPRFFPNQTIRVTNTLFHERLEKGEVIGTGVDLEGMADTDISTEGGAVLDPSKLIAPGLKLFLEWPNRATRAFAWLNDFDFSAQYPTNIAVMNISRQTKLSTMLGIKANWVQMRYGPNDAVEVLCSYLITPNANGVELGVEFFRLPDYDEMLSNFQAHLLSQS